MKMFFYRHMIVVIQKTINVCRDHNIGLYISSTLDPVMAYEEICNATIGL